MELEAEFKKAMKGMVDQIIHTYNTAPTRLIQDMKRIGAIAAAKKQLNKEPPSYGFYSMFDEENPRWDLTIEYLVLKKEFQSLFTEDELECAKRRLREVRYLKN